jgi:CubicO group peptidase (beta-lactamase class C family)
MPPGKEADNPDAIGPAGTIHASITDWAKFARFHLRREPGTLLKNAESFDKLNAVLPTSANHGIGGWLVHEQERFGGHSIQMAGSNTMWFALMWIFPGYDMAILVTTNAAPENAFQFCDQVIADLMGRYR